MVKFTFEQELKPSKHFRNTWLRKWDWDMHDLRIALQEAYKIVKVGKHKYEAYTRYKAGNKSRKVVFVAYNDVIYIITGAEGK